MSRGTRDRIGVSRGVEDLLLLVLNVFSWLASSSYFVMLVKQLTQRLYQIQDLGAIAKEV